MRTTQQTILMRRKLHRITNYKKRLKLLIAKTPRLVVRKTLKYISTQLITYNQQGDHVSTSAHSKELTTFGYTGSPKNIPAAYLTGLLLAQKAKKAKITKAILDSGLYPSISGSKIYAALKGTIDGGISIPHDPSSLPTSERISGIHIIKYAQTDCHNKNQFSLHPSKNLSTEIEMVKKKIMESR
ncbi:MAG: 50S ribosomal protein L18 [Nanoarchaeota archaeon]